MNALFTCFAVAVLGFASSMADATKREPPEIRLEMLRELLEEFQGYYLKTDSNGETDTGLLVALARADDHLILDLWSKGKVERLLEVPIREMFSEGERQVPAMFYFTGGRFSSARFGNFSRAALAYFFLLYSEKGVRKVSFTVQEFGRDIVRIKGASDSAQGHWSAGPTDGTTLFQFLTGDYPVPATHARCEVWLRARGTSTSRKF